MTRIPKVRLGLVALLAGVLLTLAGAPAWAHGDKAFNLVREAIALIANKPGNHDAIAERINEALKAKDTSNVKMPLVQQARDAFGAGDLHQARRLLEQSIGAQVHTMDTDPAPANSPPPDTARTPAPEASASPAAAMADMPGRGGLTGGDWALIVIFLAVGLGGIALAARMRPHLPHQTETAR